jgi:myo-inositol-1(or 4)-monophosphatase
VTERDLAVLAAETAGAVIASRTAEGVRHKGRVDLVTEVDLASERAIREVLARHTPDVPVLGEEGGGAVSAETRWIVDPLDGTTNFVHGFPFYAVSVALQVDGQLVAGAVLDVPRRRMFSAAAGRGAECDGTRLRVSTRSELLDALLGTGFPYDRTVDAATYLVPLQAFLERSQGVRRAGAAALDLAMVAAGELDGFWEFGLGAWDVAAGVLLIEEAGGRVTSHDGMPLDLARPSPLASNGRLHAAMVAVMTC